jgi:hypothetical protein
VRGEGIVFGWALSPWSSSGEKVRRESGRSCKAGETLGSAGEAGGVWRGWDWTVGRPAASVVIAATGGSPTEGSGSTVKATEGAESTVEANEGARSTVEAN